MEPSPLEAWASRGWIWFVRHLAGYAVMIRAHLDEQSRAPFDCDVEATLGRSSLLHCRE